MTILGISVQMYDRSKCSQYCCFYVLQKENYLSYNLSALICPITHT